MALPKALQQGINVAHELAGALYHLGFEWEDVGHEGLLILTRFDPPTDEAEKFLEGMRIVFEEYQNEPPDDTIPRDQDNPAGWVMSEYMVVEKLIETVSEAVDEDMPHSAIAINDVLSDYENYIAGRKGWDPTGRGPETALQARLNRIQHAVNEVEFKAAGRA